VVQLYQLQAGHGNSPNVLEQERYFRDLLDRITHPTALSIHQASGYLAPVDLTIRLCNDYQQVKAVNLHGPSPTYLVRLRDGIRPEVRLYGGMINVLNFLPLGGWGCQAAEPNIAPKLCQAIIDRYLAGNLAGAGEAYAAVLRLWDATTLPAPFSAGRTAKAALKALGLPGGPTKKPYILPDDSVIQQVRTRVQALHIPELE
jgi:dihydrodipicolinate synthase/N-acetylneuraminate lyase